MKKINKFLTSFLAVSVLVSCFVASSFAATKARTFTIKADKTEGLKAGDIVTIEVQADELLHSWNAGYTVYFDPAVFTLNTESGGRGKPKKYVDEAWFNEVNDQNGIIGWYWGVSRTENANADTGEIACAWLGNTSAGEGVTESDNQKDYAIGRYFLIVKEGAPAGKTQITVDGKTAGFGENSADSMTYVPATLTVGEDAAPQSFNAKVPYGAKAQAATGIKFNLTTDDVTKNVKTVDYKVPFFKTEDDKSKIENIGNIAVGLTINDVPSGVTVKANSAELY